MVFSNVSAKTMIDEIIVPMRNPLKEKLRKNKYGSSRGVRTIPEIYPANIICERNIMCADACRRENPSALIPERREKNASNITRYRTL